MWWYIASIVPHDPWNKDLPEHFAFLLWLAVGVRDGTSDFIIASLRLDLGENRLVESRLDIPRRGKVHVLHHFLKAQPEVSELASGRDKPFWAARGR
jgi:hypothetical protein